MFRSLLAAISQGLKLPLLVFIVIYQKLLSPILGPRCRFYPSCSCYAHEAIKTHSIHYALWLITKRLLKCQPFCTGGIDPVPPTRRENV